MSWSKTIIGILIGLMVVVGGIGVWKLWQQKQERKNNDNITDANSTNYG